MKNIYLLAKCGFAILVIISIAILIERLTTKTNFWVPGDDSNRIVTVSPSLPPDIESILDDKFEKCMVEHAKFSYFTPGQINKLLNNNLISKVEDEVIFSKNSSSPCTLPLGKCIKNLAIDFNILMKVLDIGLVLIEPSILFCMLPQTGKFSLLTRGFSLQKFKGRKYYSLEGARNVITFGVFHLDAKILEESSAKRKILSAGFKIFKYQGTTESWKHVNESETAFEPLHYFFTQFDLVMHIIVLYPRAAYMWYPGLKSPEISLKHLLFLNDEIFENFTISPLHLDAYSTTILTPSPAVHFLLEAISSEFTECKVLPSNITSVARYLPFGKDKQNDLVLTAITDLKNVLSPWMVVFWLWGKTLFGWFEKCDILYYSAELELAISSKSIEILSIPMLFNKSSCLSREASFNLNESNKFQMVCHGVRVNIFILQESNRLIWYEDKEQKKKFTFPKYSLCSTDILGQKMNIPCNIAELLSSHQGLLWRNITLSSEEKM